MVLVSVLCLLLRCQKQMVVATYGSASTMKNSEGFLVVLLTRRKISWWEEISFRLLSR